VAVELGLAKVSLKKMRDLLKMSASTVKRLLARARAGSVPQEPGGIYAKEAEGTPPSRMSQR
jgi:hypothetical protein